MPFVLSVRIPPSLARDLHDLAIREQNPLSAVVRRLLMAALRREGERS